MFLDLEHAKTKSLKQVNRYLTYARRDLKHAKKSTPCHIKKCEENYQQALSVFQ